MSGPQFANVQTWSRKANKANASVETIIAEALREEGFTSHLDGPKPPEVLMGKPSQFRQMHADHVAARSTSVTLADGTERRRSIRADRQTMASIVLSYPVPWSAITSDDAKEAHANWQRKNVEWLKLKYGDQLKVVLAHTDEKQPHLHAWLLPNDPGADATTLHPGKAVKKQVEAEAKAEGIEPREAVKLGNQAYKKAMREWQDQYHAAVGVPLGLTRSGPLRRRLSRDEWKAEKAAAKANAAAIERAEAAKSEIQVIEAQAAKVTEATQRLSVASEKIEARKASIDELEKAAEAKAERLISKARSDAQKIIADADAVAHEANMQAMKIAQEVHEQREVLKGLTSTIRGLIMKFARVMGVGVDARDLGRDLIKIEQALSASEKSVPQADRPEI